MRKQLWTITVATWWSSASVTPGRAVIARALAAKPDVVVIDFPHAAVLMPAAFPAASVLFTHNIEAKIYERHAMTAEGLWRAIWRDQARKMQGFDG